MLISAYILKDNLAVWNALTLHIDLIKNYKDVKVIVNDIFYSNYLPIKDKEKYEYIVINNKIELFKILNLKEKEIFTISILDTLEIKLISYLMFKKVETFFWVQGVIPEESLMRNNSKLRFRILSFLERLSLNISDRHIFVSDYMVNFYKEKYKIKSKNYVVIPCSSDLIYTGVEKIKNSFCYIGGLSKWQKIGEALKIYSDIQNKLDNSEFHLITRDIEQAKVIIDKYENIKSKIKIYSLDNRKEIEETLSKMEFGFLLREDVPVNNVSSPIKLAEYLSCDVNVIISDSVYSYASYIKDYKAGIVVDKNFNLNQIPKYNNEVSFKLFCDIFLLDTLKNKYRKFIGEK
ncbi:glycosyltransferase [Aliarcobacter butzleri]|uniref:glycosyltransferase n=1 Tax=Aliarcobacter butzleri TaxID=28197 RepID=UPI0021B41A30|nr:glycosyltransferase [Aliarcobacter butzleri]MCT7551042.1 glycosyltransferase [Aliarcobacter butzleri]MCT7560012.1 glycosyltransferase [Aliarcobacter butzleri]